MRGVHNTQCMIQYGLCAAWRVCDLWVSMCSRRGTCMAGWGVHDARGIEKSFEAARESARHAWQDVGKVLLVIWEWRNGRLSRDIDEEGYAIWRVYRAAIWWVYEGYEGLRGLCLCQMCILGVLWSAENMTSTMPSRGGISRLLFYSVLFYSIYFFDFSYYYWSEGGISLLPGSRL